jgi:hypothetical protein
MKHVSNTSLVTDNFLTIHKIKYCQHPHLLLNRVLCHVQTELLSPLLLKIPRQRAAITRCFWLKIYSGDEGFNIFYTLEFLEYSLQEIFICSVLLLL